jgi:hypothetical protein
LSKKVVKLFQKDGCKKTKILKRVGEEGEEGEGEEGEGEGEGEGDL